MAKVEEKINPFGAWLRLHRANAEISLLDLVAKIGNLCSDAYLSKLENDTKKGKRGNFKRPDIEIVDALAEALHRPKDEARVAAEYAPINDFAIVNNKKLAMIDFSYPGLPPAKKGKADLLIELLEELTRDEDK